MAPLVIAPDLAFNERVVAYEPRMLLNRGPVVYSDL